MKIAGYILLAIAIWGFIMIIATSAPIGNALSGLCVILGLSILFLVLGYTKDKWKK